MSGGLVEQTCIYSADHCPLYIYQLLCCHVASGVLPPVCPSLSVSGTAPTTASVNNKFKALSQISIVPAQIATMGMERGVPRTGRDRVIERENSWVTLVSNSSHSPVTGSVGRE